MLTIHSQLRTSNASYASAICGTAEGSSAAGACWTTTVYIDTSKLWESLNDAQQLDTHEVLASTNSHTRWRLAEAIKCQPYCPLE